jgi:hypothetical protein
VAKVTKSKNRKSDEEAQIQVKHLDKDAGDDVGIPSVVISWEAAIRFDTVAVTVGFEDKKRRRMVVRRLFTK